MALQRLEPILRIHGANGFYHAPTLEQQQREDRAWNAVVGHVLIAVREMVRERDAVALALRVAAAHRARVALLHVLEPVPQRSLHWLDGIGKLHGAFFRPCRDRVSAIDKVRAEMAEILKREIPRELREGVDIRCECRAGDVANEIARFAKEQAADLVFLCNCPSAWRFSLWPGLSRRVASLLPKPTVLAHART